MTTTEILLQVIKYLLPSVAFFGAAFYFTNKWVELNREKMKSQAQADRFKKGNDPVVQDSSDAFKKKNFFPMQVDAYQRLVLFLERISPNNMVMRMSNPGLPYRAFQQHMLESIRQEYEHNLAQQIFVSIEGWELVKGSKDEVTKIINMAATNLPETALATDLARAILEITAQLNAQPTDNAIGYLKQELNKKLV